MIFFTLNAQAKIVLPEFLTKQATNNIRFLSQDGKFTYYQKRSGSLLFSTNYKVQEILKAEIGTNYTLFATPARKKIVVLQNTHFNNFYSLRAKENIYLLDYGESVAREIGTGIAPTLLLGDSWLSFYDPYAKILNFENTINSSLKFSIKLNNRINPYFVPQVLMSDENTVYYTDLSEAGVYGVLEFKRNTSKSEIIYKAPGPMVRAEICIQESQLFLGVFGIHFAQMGSSISKIGLPLKDFSKREAIYTSELNDVGHLICDYNNSSIIFVKNTGSHHSPSYDVVSLNTGPKRASGFFSVKPITPFSDKTTITNIINMDGVLLSEEKGKYYIVRGNVDYKNADSLKVK